MWGEVCECDEAGVLESMVCNVAGDYTCHSAEEAEVHGTCMAGSDLELCIRIRIGLTA